MTAIIFIILYYVASTIFGSSFFFFFFFVFIFGSGSEWIRCRVNVVLKVGILDNRTIIQSWSDEWQVGNSSAVLWLYQYYIYQIYQIISDCISSWSLLIFLLCGQCYAHVNLCHFFYSSWRQGLAATSACRLFLDFSVYLFKFWFKNPKVELAFLVII